MTNLDYKDYHLKLPCLSHNYYIAIFKEGFYIIINTTRMVIMY